MFKIVFSALCARTIAKKQNSKLNHIFKLIINSNSPVNYLGFPCVYNHMTNQRVNGL